MTTKYITRRQGHIEYTYSHTGTLRIQCLACEAMKLLADVEESDLPDTLNAAVASHQCTKIKRD